MKTILIIIFFNCFAAKVTAQYWDSIGRFSYPPDIFYFDTLDNRLYIAGSFYWYDSSEIHGFGYYKTDSLFGLGCGFDQVSTSCQFGKPWAHSFTVVHDLVRYKGVLYATGSFRWAGGKVVNGIAKWDSTDWAPIGKGLRFWVAPSSPVNDGVGYGFEIYQDTLFLFGIFDSINDVEAFSLAKFDGSTWYPAGLPRFDTINPNSPNFIFAAEWYKGELYIGGGFYYTGVSPVMQDIGKWNGNAWEAIPTSCTGSGIVVRDMEIFDNQLVVAGNFDPYYHPGCQTGYNVSAWNGSSWDTLRGGVDDPYHGSMVFDVFVAEDSEGDSALYVLGDFETAGGLPCRDLAKWDGSKWCVLDTTGMHGKSYFFIAGAKIEDSIYVSNSYQHINQNPAFKNAARWVGDISFLCQQPLSVEGPASIQDLRLFPNPANSRISLDLPSDIRSVEVKVFDHTGRLVLGPLNYAVSSGTIDVSMLPAGIYQVKVLAGTGTKVRKLVVE